MPPYRNQKQRHSAAKKIQKAFRKHRAGRYFRGRKMPMNRINSNYKGSPNKIMTQRTLDYGVIDFGDSTYNKPYSSTNPATSSFAFNFPNFKISMMPDWKEWSAMFGRYKLYALEIRMIPLYTWDQVNVLTTTPLVTPANAVCNLLVTRMSTKYDTSPNNDRFNAAYAQQDIEQLDQFVKKKTICISPTDFKGFKAYTKKPRQIAQVQNSFGPPANTVAQNVTGKWNDFDTSPNIEYVCNDCIYIRNADETVNLPSLVHKYRVIYKVYLGLSGFQ